MIDIQAQAEEIALKETGIVLVSHTREMLEDLALGPVTVEFFESMLDDICDHYTRKDGEDYLVNVGRVGELLDEYLGEDRLAVVNWLETPNSRLGDAKPIELLLIGKAKSLIKFIEWLIQEKPTSEV